MVLELPAPAVVLGTVVLTPAAFALELGALVLALGVPALALGALALELRALALAPGALVIGIIGTAGVGSGSGVVLPAVSDLSIEKALSTTELAPVSAPAAAPSLGTAGLGVAMEAVLALDLAAASLKALSAMALALGALAFGLAGLSSGVAVMLVGRNDLNSENGSLAGALAALSLAAAGATPLEPEGSSIGTIARSFKMAVSSIDVAGRDFALELAALFIKPPSALVVVPGSGTFLLAGLWSGGAVMLVGRNDLKNEKGSLAGVLAALSLAAGAAGLEPEGSSIGTIARSFLAAVRLSFLGSSIGTIARSFNVAARLSFSGSSLGTIARSFMVTGLSVGLELAEIALRRPVPTPGLVALGLELVALSAVGAVSSAINDLKNERAALTAPLAG